MSPLTQSGTPARTRLRYEMVSAYSQIRFAAWRSFRNLFAPAYFFKDRTSGIGGCWDRDLDTIFGLAKFVCTGPVAAATSFTAATVAFGEVSCVGIAVVLPCSSPCCWLRHHRHLCCCPCFQARLGHAGLPTSFRL